MNVLTGNDLKTGDVIWWTGSEWSRHVRDAVDVGDHGEAVLAAEEGAGRVNTAYITDAEMTARMPWMVGAHLLFVFTFVLLWAKGFAENGGPKCAALFGLMMGLFFHSDSLMTYVVTPVPLDIVLKWFFSGLAQAVLLGLLTFFVYKPKPQA